MLPHEPYERVETWFATVPRVDLVLVLGTERDLYVKEAQAKNAEVAYFNFFEANLDDTEGAWFVDGDLSQSLPLVVSRALCEDVLPNVTPRPALPE